MNRERRSAGFPRAVRAQACILVALAIAVAAGPASADIDRAGTTAANFLTLGAGAGVLGMGGAGLSLGDDLAAAAWNPAALARLGRTEVVFSHAALAAASAQDWAGLGGPLRFAQLAGAFTGLIQGEGSFEGRDALNNPTGSFDVSSSAFGFGVARAFGPLVTAGVGLKYVSEDLGSVRGSGVAFDAGLQVRSGAFGFGAAAQNAFGRMKYDAASYDFPSNVGIGVSYAHPASGVRVALDLNFPHAYYSDVRAGVEWRWNERFALRTGYRSELGAAAADPLGGPTFGMGAGVRGLWLDYGYLLGGHGEGQHRVGIRFHPGAMGWPGDDLGGGGGNPDRASASVSASANAGATQAVTTRPAPAAAAARPAPTAAAARPTYVQRAKAARGVSNAASSDRKAAASQPNAAAAPKPGVAPASGPAAKADSAAARDTSLKAAPAASPPAAAKPGAAAPGSRPATMPDSSALKASGAEPPALKPSASPPPAGNVKRPAKVKVKHGQTLEDIAHLYGTSAAAIMMENNLTSDRVRSGQVLKLPPK